MGSAHNGHVSLCKSGSYGEARFGVRDRFTNKI
jgi:hypothetical protein